MVPIEGEMQGAKVYINGEWKTLSGLNIPTPTNYPIDETLLRKLICEEIKSVFKEISEDK